MNKLKAHIKNYSEHTRTLEVEYDRLPSGRAFSSSSSCSGDRGEKSSSPSPSSFGSSSLQS